MHFTLSRRGFIASSAVLSAAPMMARAKVAEAPVAAPQNPLVRQRADAQIFRHDDGHYYMTGSVPEYDRLVLRRSKTIAGLTSATEAVLWRHEKTGPLSGFIWAPELHQIDGVWHMYRWTVDHLFRRRAQRRGRGCVPHPHLCPRLRRA